MTREVYLHFAYMLQFSRRKGWRMKSSQNHVVRFSSDAPFEVHRISLGFISGHKTQIGQFARSYRLSIDGIGKDLLFPPAADYSMSYSGRFEPGSTSTVSFHGTPFGKMRKTMRWGVMLSGVKVFKVSEEQFAIHEAACKRDFPAGVQEESAEEMAGLE